MNRVVADCTNPLRLRLGHIAALPSAKVAAAVLALALGPTTTAANISEVYALALQKDPTLAAVRASTAARKQSVALSRSSLLPRLVASAGASKSTLSIDGTDVNPSSETFGRPFLDREITGRNWSASMSQPVLDMQSWFNYRSSQARAQQADWDLQTAEQALITRVADAYLNVLRGEAALESVVAAEEAVGRQLEQVQQRFDVGLVAITDVLEAKAEYDNAVVNRIQAEGNHDIFFEGLRTLTAEPVLEIDRLADDLPIVNPAPDDEEEWVRTALADSYRIRSAQEALTAAERDLRTALAGHMPTITASASYNASTGSQAFGGFVIPSQSTGRMSYALSFNMPIFQGLRTYANVGQARFNVEQARQQLIEQELAIARDTRNLFRSVVTEVVRVDARGEAIKSSESALEATQTGYEVGTRNIVDVLLAQRRLFAAQYDYATSRYDYVINLLRLKATAGTLAEADVDELSRYTAEESPIRPFSAR